MDVVQIEYIDRSGKLQVGSNTLNAEEEARLRLHQRECEVSLSKCEECYRLYRNIGHYAYTAALVEGMDDESIDDGGDDQ